MLHVADLTHLAPLPSPLLSFSGTSPDGHTLAATARFLTWDGSPIFPVTGEFHYARYNRADWERELCKMKAGGVDIVATYIFWIHHEEQEGIFDFSGQRDLHHFVKLCAKVGLGVILRIGPWCHGECRNGGFPDWIQFGSFKTRTNDPQYLSYVERWFREIERQVHGMFFSAGGPIVGIQLENEYRSYAEPDHERRREHMHTLREMALACGFHAPLYTATAWGTATLNEMETLPVLGGYADAAWANSDGELPENAHFLFQPPMNDPSIGSDLKVDDGDYAFDIDINRYPYLTAELGGGMQVTLRRRVVIFPKDTEAIAVCMIGSGSAMLGYYMYHGGTNPDGKLSTLEESGKVGAPNTLPVKSYDFQAMLRENGEAHESYHLTRRHHLLLHTFGSLLASAVTVIPKDSATDPADLHTLRYAVRHNMETGAGFVIVNNHLRRRTLDAHSRVSFRILTAQGTAETVPVNIRNHDTLLIPYHLPLGDAVLESTNATPLCAIGKRWFFYTPTDESPVYRFSSGNAEIITLSEADSRRAYLLGNRLWIADCLLYEKEGNIVAEYDHDTVITVWHETGDAEKRICSAPKVSAECHVHPLSEDTGRIDLTYPTAPSFPAGCIGAEPILTLNYTGDRIEIYDDPACTHLVADWFTNGLPLKLSLGQLNYPKTLYVRVFPTVHDGRYFDLPVHPGHSLDEARIDYRFISLLP